MQQDILTRLSDALRDRYAVQEEVGSGGMAIVYRAEEVRHGRRVAIKVIRPDLAQALGSERFLREIRVTASLSHPNIPPLLDSGQAADLLYFVMPYMEGATLQSRLRKETRLGLREALTIARDIAEALEYAHGLGVVHRDVKPSNVFLEAGRARLGDFGIALAEQSDSFNTTSSAVLGTVEYMSPEQCSASHHVDGRADIYSLGCVLYEMLGGEPPFHARSRVAVMARQLSEPVPSLSTLRGDLPPHVDGIVQKCLAKAPGDRFQTATELREALDTALSQAGSPSGPVRSSPARWWRRAAVGGAAVGVVATVILAIPRPPGAGAVGANRVVVFPLADRGGGAEVGADVSIMIGNALLHTEPLRWIDGWEMLSPEHRSDPNRLVASEARAITLGRGARHYITGGVALAGDSIAVRLVLHDAQGDSIVTQAAAVGAAEELTPDQLGLRAVVQLLPALLDPARDVDVSYLTERDPAAVAFWIAGDRAYRQARFSAALELYRSAVETDSLLAMAALKGAQAASWSERLENFDDLLRLGMRHDSVLPARHRAFAEGLASYSVGHPGDAVVSFRRALDMDPEWSEALTGLGEVYWHLIPPDLGGPDSAAALFGRAVLHDPGFSPPVVHLVEDAFRRGSHDRGAELLERLRVAGGESAAALDWLDLMELCTALAGQSGSVSFPSGTSTLALLRASRLFATGGADWDCAEAGFRDVLGRPDLSPAERWMAVVGLQGILTAENRDEELAALLRDALAQLGSTNFLFALAVLAGADLADQAEAVDARAAADWGPDYRAVGPLTTWLLAVWNAHERDLPTLDRLVARMEALSEERGDAHTAMLARAVLGHQALALGDSSRALEIFSSLESVGTRVGFDVGLSEALAPERIILAELRLARGEHEEAYRVAAIFDHPEPLIFVPFLARSLEVRLEAARALPGAAWARRAEEASARLQALGRGNHPGRESGGIR